MELEPDAAGAAQEDMAPDDMVEVPTGTHWGAVRARVRGSRLHDAAPGAADPRPSPLVGNIASAVHHACRIAEPMVRAGFLRDGHRADPAGRGIELFVPVSWDVALDLVAGQLDRIRARFGNEAFFAASGWGSAGRFHDARGQLARFFNGFGGFVDQVTNYSFGAASVIVPRVVGSIAPVIGPVTDWKTIARETETMVLFGGMAPKNGQVNQGGVWRHELADWQAEAAAAGVRFVAISPLGGDIDPALGAEWIPIRPNTDTALMLALAHTLVAEGRHDRDFLERHCVGFERFERYLFGSADGRPKDAAWAAGITGVGADTIRALARRVAGGRTLLSASWSVQRAHHGEQPCWALIALAAVLGQIGLPGGGFAFGYGAINRIGSPAANSVQPRLPTGSNGVSTTVPVARFTDMLLDPGGAYHFNGERRTYPDIRLMYWCGGNPFHKQQDLNRLLQAWRKPEVIVVHEPWWNATARRADIVLPATTPFERNDIGASAFDRHLIAQKQAIPPVGAARSDFDIFAGLAERLGFRQLYTEGRDETAWLHHLYDEARATAAARGIAMPTFDVFWEGGAFAFDLLPESETPFAAYRADPASFPLKTPSGRIEIFSETIAGYGYDDCPGHPAWLEPAEWLGGERSVDFPLHLVTNQPATRLHSQMDCGDVSQAGKRHGRERILMHPDDARARGIADGDVVRVFNDRGACLAAACLSEGILRRVVQMATGAWFDPLDPGRPGSLEKHGNPNVLTLDRGTSRLAQCCSAQTALVEVERFAGPLPDITAYGLPEMTDEASPEMG